MMRKLLLFMLGSLMVFLTACGGSESAGSQGGSQNPADSKPEPVELVFYNISRDAESVFMEQYGSAIQAKFPHITIKYVERVAGQTDLAQYIPTKQPIDLIWGSLGSWPGIFEYQLQYDMEDLLKKHKVDLNRFEPGLIDAVRALGNGKLYGIPVENSTTIIAYNKDLFDKFGVPYPKDGMTWEEFANLVRRMNRNIDGVIYTSYTPSENHLVLSNAFGLPLIDPVTNRSRYDDPNWKKIIETELLQFTNDPVYQEALAKAGGKLLSDSLFYKDRTMATANIGPAHFTVFKQELSQFNWDIVSYPYYPELPKVGTSPYPQVWSVASISQHKDEAMKVIEFLTSDEFQMERSKRGIMTSLANDNIKKAMGREAYFKDKNYAAFYYNKFPQVPAKSEWDSKAVPYQFLSKKLRDIANGKTDVNTALRTAHEELNQKLNELQGK